jgi:hypothetical protein
LKHFQDSDDKQLSWQEGVQIAIIFSLLPLFLFSTCLGGPRFFATHPILPSVLGFFGILFGWLCASRVSSKKKMTVLWLFFAGFLTLGILILALLWQGADHGGLLFLALVIFLITLGGGLVLVNFVMGLVLRMEAMKRRRTLTAWTVISIVLITLQAIGLLPSGLLE